MNQDEIIKSLGIIGRRVRHSIMGDNTMKLSISDVTTMVDLIDRLKELNEDSK